MLVLQSITKGVCGVSLITWRQHTRMSPRKNKPFYATQVAYSVNDDHLKTFALNSLIKLAMGTRIILEAQSNYCFAGNRLIEVINHQDCSQSVFAVFVCCSVTKRGFSRPATWGHFEGEHSTNLCCFIFS